MLACPYNARHILPAKRTNPNLPTRVVDKCTFCLHRVREGLVPACVQTCIGRARVFGDINDPNSEVRRLVDTYSTIVLKPGVGTKPQVYYILANRSGLEPAKVFKTISAQQKQDLKEHHEHFEHYVGR